MKIWQKIAKIIIALLTSVVIVALIFSGYNYLKIKYAVLPEGFTVTAHTGCEETEDNSLDSIRKGYESGADIVEFDLNFTSDGEAVLSHDEPQSGCVTLDEAFALIAELPDLKVNVDCKSVANLKVVTELAQKHGISDRIFYTGIREENIKVVREQTPDVAYWLNYDVDVENAFRLLATIGYARYHENTLKVDIITFRKWSKMTDEILPVLTTCLKNHRVLSSQIFEDMWRACGV